MITRNYAERLRKIVHQATSAVVKYDPKKILLKAGSIEHKKCSII